MHSGPGIPMHLKLLCHLYLKYTLSQAQDQVAITHVVLESLFKLFQDFYIAYMLSGPGCHTNKIYPEMKY